MLGDKIMIIRFNGNSVCVGGFCICLGASARRNGNQDWTKKRRLADAKKRWGF